LAKVNPPLRATESVIAGARYGVWAWMVYAIAEVIFTAYLPWLMQRHIARPQHLLFLGFTLVIYALAGAALGAVCGLMVWRLRPDHPDRVLRALTTCILVIIFGLHAFSIEDYLLSPRMLVLPLLLAIALVSACSSSLATHLRPFANPWVAAMICVGVQWLTRDYLNQSGRFIRFVVLLLGIGLVLVSSWLLSKRSQAGTRLTARPALALTSLFLFLLSAGTWGLQPAPIRKDIYASKVSPVRSPNIILVVLDTVGASHLSLYGYERDTTPYLRKLAQQATLYRHSYSAGDMTLPSHTSMFTGLYPSQHGAHYSLDAPVGRPMVQSQVTLAEILSAHGYKTMAVVANGGYLTTTFGFDQGFATYDQRLPAAPLRSSPSYVLKSVILKTAVRLFPETDLCYRSRTAQDINESVFSLLEETKRNEQPLFLFVNYMDAHYPYLPPSPFDRMFPGNNEKFTDARFGTIWEKTMLRNQPVPREDQSHLISQYDGGIAYIDSRLAALVEHIKQRNLYDNSILIITSDHGEAFGERNLLDHGGMSVYQDQVSVPLLIKYPHQTTPEIVDANVSGVDLFPTILDVLGFAVPKSAQGQSLRRIKHGEERMVFCESFPGGRALKTNPARFSATHQAILKGPYKLIRHSDGKRELYDLSKDPGERVNLYKAGDEPGSELDDRLSRWSRSMNNTSNTPEGKYNSETLERLKSLGYVQ
jgi:arylsulfatase A-like enzyme